MKRLFICLFVSFLFLSGCNRTRCNKTIENLKTAIQGETTTSARYAAFAVRAEKEGHTKIARLFEAVSKSESIHAFNHQKVLMALGVKMVDFKPFIDVKTTKENLQVALDGETYLTRSLYLLFFRDTRSENVEVAETSFTWTYNTELKHLQFFHDALSALENFAENTLPLEYVICPVCGNTYDFTKLDDKCSICATSRFRFLKI